MGRAADAPGSDVSIFGVLEPHAGAGGAGNAGSEAPVGRVPGHEAAYVPPKTSLGREGPCGAAFGRRLRLFVPRRV